MTSRIDRINGLVGSIAVKAPVKVATTAAITLSGAQTIDGVALTADESPRQRVLVKDQASGVDNGIYDVNSGAWERSPDFDGDRDVVNGTAVLVAEGTTPFGKLYYLSATNPVDIGTDSLTFTLVPQFGFEVVDDLTPQLGGFLDPNGYFIGMDKGSDIASASPIVIGTDGYYFDVTGTTNFAAMTVAANRHFFLQFDGALTMTHHATNLDLPGKANITTAAGDVAEFFSTGANTVQCVNYTRADGTILILLDENDMASDSATFPASQQSIKAYVDTEILDVILPVHISGLILSNDTDTDHDILIASGVCTASGGGKYLTLSTGITKQIDAAYADGDDAGGLFSGTVANDTTYHVFIIEKDADSTIHAGFDTSISAANKPAGYTKYRRIGSIMTDGSANIHQFIQIGNDFIWKTPTVDYTSAGTGTSENTVTLRVPLGIAGRVRLNAEAGATSWMYIRHPDTTDTAPGAGTAPLSQYYAGDNQHQEIEAYTNASSQVMLRANVNVTASAATISYTDLRGQ